MEVGDGTFTIPTRFMSGTWSLHGGSVQIDSVWTKVADQPRTATTVIGIPKKPGDGSGAATMVWYWLTPEHPGWMQSINWTYSNGEVSITNGTGIAREGVTCDKVQDGD